MKIVFDLLSLKPILMSVIFNKMILKILCHNSFMTKVFTLIFIKEFLNLLLLTFFQNHHYERFSKNHH